MKESTHSRKAGKAAAAKPPKPCPEFPLGPANNGRWQKKINGDVYYFGHWGRVVNGSLTRVEGDGWQEALAVEPDAERRWTFAPHRLAW